MAPARCSAAASRASPASIGSKNSASRKPSGYSTWRISGRSWSRAMLPATACSSARTRKSRPASRSSMPARGPPRCGATARPTTRPRRSFERATRAERLRLRARRRAGLEFQRGSVHAVALSGRLRAVVEDVAEMAAAAAAMHFGSRKDEAVIVRSADRVLDRREEARPPGAAVELGFGAEQRQIASGAGKNAGAVLVVERARIRPFRPVLPQHPELLGVPDLLPFRIRFRNFELLGAGVRPAW